MTSIIYTLFCRITEIVFGVLMLIITSRLFGVEGRGLYSAGMVVSGLFATLCSINLSRGLYSDICSSAKFVDKYVNKLFPTIIVLFLAVSILGLFIYALAYMYEVKLFSSMPIVFVVLFALYVPSLIWTNVANTLYSSLGIITIKNNINLLTKSLFGGVVTLIYFYTELSLILFCSLFVLFATINMIAECVLLNYRYASECSLDISSIKRLAQKSIAWYPDLVGGYLISGASSVIVVYYLSVQDVGIFGVTMQIFSIGFMLVPTVLQIYVSEHIAKYGAEKSIKTLFKYMGYYTVYIILTYLVIYLLGEVVVENVLGREFIEVISLLKIMAIAGWISGVVLLLAPLWTAMNYVKFITINTMLLGGISFLVLTIMTDQYMLYGAAWGMVIIYAIGLIGNIFLLRHTLKEFARKRISN